MRTKKSGRTGYDEYKLDEELRAEEAVKSEVIGEMRTQLKHALENDQVLTTTLIATTSLLQSSLDALQTHRERHLQWVNDQLRDIDSGRCVPGCRRHDWTTEHGWFRPEGR